MAPFPPSWLEGRRDMLPRPDSSEIDGKERLRKAPVGSPVLPPRQRIRNFDEVHLPWTPEMAMAEASRCLQCPDQPCVAACPLHNDIPLALWLTEHGDFAGAAAVFRQTSHLSEVLSRVCSQDHQCESACPHIHEGMPPVAIGRIEKFLADRYRKEEGWAPQRPPCSGHRAAIVGAGPAGLTVAELLAEKGHCVTVFDQWPSGGGRLRYGISRFRLDHALVRRRLDLLRELGVEFVFDTRVGGDTGAKELFARGFDAVFLGTGAAKPPSGDIPGAHLRGVCTASSFLVRANVEQNLRPSELEDPPEVGDSVLVVGSDCTALDCGRTALRLGASSVTCLCRTGGDEVGGNPRDEALAREEGVVFQRLVEPVEILSDETGHASGVRIRRLRPGPLDESGSAALEAVPGSEFEISADTVVFALESGPDPDIIREISGLEQGELLVDETTGRTGREMVWAGGECVTGTSTVAEAVAQGRAAAADIHRKLSWR